ncbi:MAG: HDOD domain-containing protein [Dehalococcoidia bacterium]|nr:MAG: HDOD domain-containing protein [Dehalococcoidia bacterium]
MRAKLALPVDPRGRLMPLVPPPAGGHAVRPVDAIAARYPAHPAYYDLVRVRQDQPDAERHLRAILEAHPELVERMVSAGRGVMVGREDLGHTLSEGIELLGFRAVHSTAVLTAVVRSFEGDTHHLDAMSFWRRAALTGATGGVIGATIGGGMDERAAVGGLMVHLGWLALDMAGPDYLERLGEISGDEPPTETDEMDAFGFVVRDLTMAVLRRWGTPEELVEAAADASAGLDTSPLAAVILRGLAAADSILAGEEPEDEAMHVLRGRGGSPGALLTRVDALLAGVMLQ